MLSHGNHLICTVFQGLFVQDMLSDKFVVNILSMAYLDDFDDQNVLEYGDDFIRGRHFSIEPGDLRG